MFEGLQIIYSRSRARRGEHWPFHIASPAYIYRYQYITSNLPCRQSVFKKWARQSLLNLSHTDELVWSANEFAVAAACNVPYQREREWKKGKETEEKLYFTLRTSSAHFSKIDICSSSVRARKPFSIQSVKSTSKSTVIYHGSSLDGRIIPFCFIVAPYSTIAFLDWHSIILL